MSYNIWAHSEIETMVYRHCEETYGPVSEGHTSRDSGHFMLEYYKDDKPYLVIYRVIDYDIEASEAWEEVYNSKNH